jgi:hypothetical protein
VFPGSGGGLLSTGPGEVHLTDSVIADNRTSAPQARGGGLHSEGADVYLVRTDIVRNGNSASDSRGAGVSVRNAGLTITDSLVSDNGLQPGIGVGIYGDHAPTTLSTLTVSDNEGGGITLLDSSLTMTSSTITRNTASVNGGGLVLASTHATLHNTTISANTAPGLGAAVFTTGSAGTSSTVMLQSTIVGNSGPNALYGSAMTLTGSIMQATGQACSHPATSGGWNLVSDATCGLAGPGDLQGTDPLLGPLQDNGGPTWTHLPLIASLAIDAIPVGTPGLCDAATPFDQRGVARPTGAACDRGAVEQ